MAEKNTSSKVSRDLRKRAEQAMHDETLPLHDMSEEEVAGLLHELRVHQVEMEMQNETLRQAQVELEQSRTKYTDLFDFAPVGYLVFDGDGVVVEANLTATGMLQVERSQLIGKPLVALLQPASRDPWRLHCQSVFKSGQTQECDLELKREDDTQMVVRLRSQPVKNEKDEVVQCRTAMTNITALARAEYRLRDSERRFRTLTENSPDIIVRINQDMRILYVNRPIENILGMPPSEFVGQTVDELGMPEELAQTWTREIQQVFNTARAGKMEFNVSTPQGLRHYIAILVPEFENEKTLTTVLITVRDITERVEAEERYSTILRNSQDAFCIFDRTGRYIEVNESCCRMFGRSSEEMLGMSLDDVLEPDQRQDMIGHMRTALTEGYARFRSSHRRPDGTLIECDITAQKLAGDRVFVLARDITELRAAEQALMQARDELEARVRERTMQLNETVATLQEEVAEKIEAQNQLMRQNDILQKVISAIPVMLCFYDSQGNVAMVNKEFERVLGYSMKDFQQASALELLCPDPEYRREVWQYMSSAEPGWRDLLVQRKRGGKIVSSWANVRLSDDSHVAIGIDIRERRRFENRLRESEERYRTLVELSPDVIIVEREGTILFVNSTAARLAGAQKAKDLVGRSILDFIHPDYVEQAKEKLARIRTERVPLPPEEEKLVRLDGGVLDVEAAGMPIVFEGGPATQIVMHDITERKQAEERLRRSAWQLQQQAELLNLAHDTIMVHDLEGRIIFWNQGAEQSYGWSREEAIGKVSHELLKTRFPHNLVEITAKLIGEGRWDGEMVHTARNGETIIVSSRWALQQDESGQPAAILVIDRDITQQKKAEEATAEARRFAESIIDTVQEALLVLGPDLKVIRANHTFYSTFQVRPEETEGQYIYDIGNRQWDIPELRRLLEEILPQNASLENFEVEHDFPHIGNRTMLLNARRIYQETQEIEMILLAIQDITVRKQQEQKIRENQHQLASLTEELLFAEERERRRLALILHDSIGQSLAFSKRELGVVQKRIPPAMAETIEGVKEQIDLAIRQTRDLTFELSPTTLHTFGLEAAIEELGDQFSRQEGFQYHFEAVDGDKPLSEQVKTFLYRAVRELLTNIAKHAQASNVFVRIDRIDGNIRIRISDDGRGFDASAKEPAADRQRFGIFSIRERLSHIGGSFRIASDPGKGTEVTLIAPLDVANLTDKRSGTS